MSREKEQAIRERAYSTWEQAGRPDGYSTDHWLRAEAELITEEALGIRDDGKLEPPFQAVLKGSERNRDCKGAQDLLRRGAARERWTTSSMACNASSGIRFAKAGFLARGTYAQEYGLRAIKVARSRGLPTHGFLPNVVRRLL